MSKIIKELDGIKVGDRVEYDGHEGYVAVISPADSFLLRLENFKGHNAEFSSVSEWYPESEKKEEENCRWCRKIEFKVINKEDMYNIQLKLIKEIKSLTAKINKLEDERNKLIEML